MQRPKVRGAGSTPVLFGPSVSLAHSELSFAGARGGPRRSLTKAFNKAECMPVAGCALQADLYPLSHPHLSGVRKNNKSRPLVPKPRQCPNQRAPRSLRSWHVPKRSSTRRRRNIRRCLGELKKDTKLLSVISHVAHNALGLQEARASAKLEVYQQGEGGRSRSHKRSRSGGRRNCGRKSSHRSDSDE